ncbi:hypothetical protein Mgra_00007024 [Meloidogyne graminicola]|uniref:Phospholipase A(2) n=1 Tax=Meloidogyne graminicola TaxID=189291 RepID=A0A8S9ZJT9_9BILA|nr:hypothetical protein Mgra_00007024 [Meloidogyne graminicola]
MLIVFILMFINNATCKKVIYWNQHPCPNCENWCAKNTNFTCNYNCEYNREQTIFHEEWGVYEDLNYGEEMKLVNIEIEYRYDYLVAPLNEFAMSKKDINIKKFCAKMSKNYKCEFNSFSYPLCSFDFSPYDKGMDICCKRIKKCYNDEPDSSILLTKECSGIDFLPSTPNYIIKIFPLKNNKNNSYWTILRWHMPYFAEKCGMKCENGRLIDSTKEVVLENREMIEEQDKKFENFKNELLAKHEKEREQDKKDMENYLEKYTEHFTGIVDNLKEDLKEERTQRQNLQNEVIELRQNYGKLSLITKQIKESKDKKTKKLQHERRTNDFCDPHYKPRVKDGGLFNRIEYGVDVAIKILPFGKTAKTFTCSVISKNTCKTTTGKWSCGASGDGKSKTFSTSEVGVCIAARSGCNKGSTFDSINDCCVIHDNCYRITNNRDNCDINFCICLRIAASKDNNPECLHITSIGICVGGHIGGKFVDSD